MERESKYAVCPGCETLLMGDEAECPNCGAILWTSGPIEEIGAKTVGLGAAAIPHGPPYAYLVRRAHSADELESMLTVLTDDDWEIVSVYFGWRIDEEHEVHFIVARHRNPPPFVVDPGVTG